MEFHRQSSSAFITGILEVIPEIVRLRLRDQKLARSEFRRPEDVVAWLGAVQSQDYGGAKWALGLRAARVTDAVVEQAFSEGRILRTHVLRPTWHFVSPADIRWVLSISGPRVHAMNAPYYRKMGLDTRTFGRGRAAIERALEGGKQLTRTELASALERRGIVADGMRLAYLVMHAELDGVICSGARRGNQITYALLEERVPPARSLDRDEALAALALRYFSSHGPATVRDFVWWSGLTTRDARAGIEMNRSTLDRQVLDGRIFWSVPSRVPAASRSPVVYLLPNYDEFGIAYRDRDVIPGVGRARSVSSTEEFAHLLVIDGELVGRWRRTQKTSTMVVEAQPFRRLTKVEKDALDAAAARYGKFLQMPATLTFVQGSVR